MNRAREVRQRLRTAEDWTPVHDHVETGCVLSTLTGQSSDTFKPSTLLKVRCRYDEKSGLIFALVASDFFSLLYKFTPGMQAYCDYCQVVPIQQANQIHVLNSEQIVAISRFNMVVISHKVDELEAGRVPCKVLCGRNIDFKVFFERPILDFSTSQNVIVVSYVG